jgi:hypothetical protein
VTGARHPRTIFATALLALLTAFHAGGSEFQKRAANADPFPLAASKKGLQVQMIDDALALGVKHAALNVDISRLVALTNGSGTVSWTIED